MSETAKFFITSLGNWKTVRSTTVEQLLARMIDALSNIRDPQTGEPAQVRHALVDDGVEVVVHGSEAVCAVARQVMARIPEIWTS